VALLAPFLSFRFSRYNYSPIVFISFVAWLEIGNAVPIGMASTGMEAEWKWKG
jgi:hypothetical protein